MIKLLNMHIVKYHIIKYHYYLIIPFNFNTILLKYQY